MTETERLTPREDLARLVHAVERLQDALAKRILAEWNAENAAKGEPDDWPGQQTWDDLVTSSHAIFRQLAPRRSRAESNARVSRVAPTRSASSSTRTRPTMPHYRGPNTGRPFFRPTRAARRPGKGDPMICEKCKAEGQTSTISIDSFGSTTLMGHSPYYDEQGRYHNHNPNWMTQHGRCSRGHRLTVQSRPECPSCEYGGEESVTRADVAAVHPRDAEARG